jgi:hypothetical protein
MVVQGLTTVPPPQLSLYKLAGIVSPTRELADSSNTEAAASRESFAS